jgi:hypothetical protein
MSCQRIANSHLTWQALHQGSAMHLTSICAMRYISGETSKEYIPNNDYSAYV